MGAQFFHADRQTDGHDVKLIVAFRNFANAPTMKRNAVAKAYFRMLSGYSAKESDLKPPFKWPAYFRYLLI